MSDVLSGFSTQRTHHFDEVDLSAVELQGRDKFRVETFLVIVNQLQTAGEDLKPDEIVQFVDFVKSKGCSTQAYMMKLIHEHDLQSTFPNVGYP